MPLTQTCPTPLHKGYQKDKNFDEKNNNNKVIEEKMLNKNKLTFA